MTRNAGDNSSDQPTRLAHLDDCDDGALLLEGSAASAQIVGLGHETLHHLLSATMVPSPRRQPHTIFYLLYDKIYREDLLRHAYALARANAGAPGVDGVSFEAVEAAGLEEWFADIRKDLVERTYRPRPVRRALIPKPGGGERPLGIPTIRDRVVQTAAKLVLEPIFEADLDPAAYGYRPRRSGADAIKAVHALLCRGYTDVVDADLSKYLETAS